MKRAFAIILGSFHLETSRAFPQHSLRHGSRAVGEGSPEARRLFRWRPPMDKTGAQKRARVGGKVECGALRLGRSGLAAPGATRVQNRRWQSPECCQRARMNRGDLFLSRCALPEQGVQREWPSTITNGQKLVLMFRLPQIIFSDVDFGQKRQLARKQPSLAKTVAGTKNGTVSRERRPEYNHCFHRARRLWRAGIRVRVRPAYI